MVRFYLIDKEFDDFVSSRPEVFCEKEFTKHVTQFTGKRLKRNLLMKLQVQKIGEFFENTFLERSRVTAYLLKVH